MSSNRGRGQPKKARFSDPTTIKEKIELEISKFDAQTANNLPKLFKVITDMAMNTNKNASATNQISCAKYLIERAEAWLEENEAVPEVEDIEEGEEEEDDNIAYLETEFHGEVDNGQ